MKSKKNTDKLKCSDEHKKLIQLLYHYSPEERQMLLQDIDNILCNMLGLDPSELPWMNPQNQNDHWAKLLDRLRLVVGKMEFESKIEKERTIH